MVAQKEKSGVTMHACTKFHANSCYFSEGLSNPQSNVATEKDIHIHGSTSIYFLDDLLALIFPVSMKEEGSTRV